MGVALEDSDPIRLTASEQAVIREVIEHLRFKQVSCSRSIRTPSGDFFVNHTAAWADGDLPPEGELPLADPNTTGAKIATAIVGLVVEEQCLMNAREGGAIDPEIVEGRIRAAKSRYIRRMASVLRNGKDR